MNRSQKAILIGMILGDAYLQKTGRQNARIRLEHSDKQKGYLMWKAGFFPEFFQGRPTFLSRNNPQYKKTYHYIRWQSNASPEIGKYRDIFYQNGGKIIPDNFVKLFNNPRTLAIWYMDDGYLYHRDKMAYIYLPRYKPKDVDTLLRAFMNNFGLKPVLKIKNSGNQVLVFPVEETRKLIDIVKPFISNQMKYKLLDPVSTDP